MGGYKTRLYGTKLRSSHITHTHVVAGFIPASRGGVPRRVQDPPLRHQIAVVTSHAYSRSGGVHPRLAGGASGQVQDPPLRHQIAVVTYHAYSRNGGVYPRLAGRVPRRVQDPPLRRQILSIKSQIPNNVQAQNTNAPDVWDPEFRYWHLPGIPCLGFRIYGRAA